MRFLLRKAAFLLVLLSALGTGALARAATTEQPALAEEFTLATGAVFEIYADHGIADPIYNWTLLLDDTFLQAGRNQWFRTRLIQPGNYLLTGEVRNADGSKRYRKTLLLHVQENVPPISALSAGSGVLVRANPAADSDGRVILTPGRSVLQLLPVSDSQEAFVLDLQKTVDANGDGNFQNDQVAENTFFSEQHTPLHLWFTEPIMRRVVTVSLRGRVGTEQEIVIVSPEQAVQEDKDRETERQRIEEERARILFTHFGSGAVKFSAYIEHEPYRHDPLLLHWNFGDGHQSLLDSPIHVYAANNVYTVRVGIRNLRTGGEIAQMETAVDVRTITPPPPPDPNETDEGEEAEPSAFSVILSTILKYGVGILFAVAIGFLVTLLIRFLRRKGGVSTLIDRAEETLTDNGQKESVQETQPMSLSIEEPEVQEAAVIETTAVDTAPPASPQPPAAKEEQAPPDDLPTAEAPPWLQQGLGEQSAPADTETQQELATPPAMSEEQAMPEPVPEPPPPPPEENGAVPPWLQQQPPAPTTETTVPAVQEPEPPIPAAPLSTAPAEPTGVTPPPTSETIDTANAPGWLQQGIQKAQQEGQTPSSPPPPELQEPPPAPEPAVPAATV
ncbi:MAG: PKD domain-containing protein, partial [Candidatus Peribacteraceae bacterium]|nr:PKD domain-containing protein [Candidatus Peribacteraceae bacterium]